MHSHGLKIIYFLSVSRTVRHLLLSRLASIEREYLRNGAAGHFLSKELRRGAQAAAQPTQDVHVQLSGADLWTIRHTLAGSLGVRNG